MFNAWYKKLVKKILIVEDETITALFIEKALQKNNYNVCAKTAKGDNVLELIKTTTPDIVLLDLKLKTNITGLDVLNQIENENIKTPVVLTTGNSDSATIASLRDMGVNHFLFKPFSQDELISKIKEIVG